jgi:hypothetical protein
MFSCYFDLNLEKSYFDGNIYLEVTFDGDVMYPRQLLTSEISSFYSSFSSQSDIADSAKAIHWSDIRAFPNLFRVPLPIVQE